METEETRTKLANAIRSLQQTGDTGSINRLVTAYKAKYKQGSSQPFNVPQPMATTAERLGQANAQANRYAKEAEVPNSALGFAGNFGKALVTNIAPHEVGLGESLQKIYGNQTDEYSDISRNLSNTQSDLAKKIKEYEVQGKDSTKLKQVYNNLNSQNQGVMSDLNKEADLPSRNKVLGQIGGTAFDILTASGINNNLKSGVLGTKSVPLIPGAATAAGESQLGQVAGQKASGLFTKAGAKNVLKGAGLGYASDVTSGLAGLRGKDRENENAFVPGAGTAIGTAIPLFSELTQSVKNKFDPEVKMKNLQDKINKDVDSLLGSTKSDITKTNFYTNRKNTDIAENLKDPYIFRGLKVKEGKVDPTEAISTIDERIDKVLESKRKLLPEIDRISMPIDKETIRQKALAALKGTVTAADEEDIANAINRQLAPYPDKMEPSMVDNLRALFRKSARDAKGLMKRGNEYAALETAARDAVFDVTDNLPFDNSSTYKQLNDYVRNMIDTKTFLETNIRGRVVKGGRLGEYSGKIIGGMAGSKLGPLGTIVGSEVGGTISNIITNNQLGNQQKLKLIRNLTDDPKILSQVDDLLKQAQEFNYPQLPPAANRIISPDPRQYNPDGSIKTPSANTLFNDFQQNTRGLENTKQLPAAKPGFINPIEAVDPRQFEPSGSLKTSPAQSLTAPKNLVTNNPTTGRFQTSYRSSNLPIDVGNKVKFDAPEQAFTNTIKRELDTTGQIVGMLKEMGKDETTELPKILEAAKGRISSNIKPFGYPTDELDNLDVKNMNLKEFTDTVNDIVEGLDKSRMLKQTQPLSGILNPKPGVTNLLSKDEKRSGVPFLEKLKDIPNQEGGFIKTGLSSFEQQSIPYQKREYYHGLSGSRLKEFLKTGKIPKAQQAFGGEFSITDDFGLAKQYAGDNGIVVKVKPSKGVDIGISSMDDGLLHDISDIGEGEFLVGGNYAIKVVNPKKSLPNQEGGFIKNIFRGDRVNSERFQDGIIKGKAEFGDAPFVSFASKRELAENFGDTVGEYKFDTKKILDYTKSKDKEALKIVGNEIDLSMDQVKKLKKLGYEAISFPNLEDPNYAGKSGGDEIRYFGDFDTKKYSKLPIKLKKK